MTSCEIMMKETRFCPNRSTKFKDELKRCWYNLSDTRRKSTLFFFRRGVGDYGGGDCDLNARRG
jgi:hypothetical protein